MARSPETKDYLDAERKSFAELLAELVEAEKLLAHETDPQAREALQEKVRSLSEAAEAAQFNCS